MEGQGRFYSVVLLAVSSPSDCFPRFSENMIDRSRCGTLLIVSPDKDSSAPLWLLVAKGKLVGFGGDGN